MHLTCWSDIDCLCWGCSTWLLMAWLMYAYFHDQKIFLKSSGKWLSALMRLERVTKQLLLKRLRWRHSLIFSQKYENIFNTTPTRISVQPKISTRTGFTTLQEDYRHFMKSNPHTAFKTFHFKSIWASVANNLVQFAILCE